MTGITLGTNLATGTFVTQGTRKGPGEISAVLPPAVSRLCEGQSVADSAEFSAMTDPANFSSTAAPIASVEVTATGAVADVSAPLAEGDLAGFRVTVTDGAGTVAVFDAGQVTVEYKYRIPPLTGNEAHIQVNDLVPDAETLSVTIDSGPYAGTYGPTAGDLRGIYLFPGTLSVSGGTALSDTLSVDPGLWSTPTGSLTLTRQWQRDGADIAGAIGLSYTIAAGDQGADITVDVTGNDGTNPPLTAESAAITIPPGEPVDPVEPGEISAVLPPAVSRLCEGQSVADSAEFSAMTDPANFSSTAAPIASVEVTATGAVADVSAPLAEGDLAGFRVTVTDGAGTVAVFDAGQVTVEYKYRIPPLTGNEAHIQVNDLVPDAETLSVTIDSGPYAGTYGPTAGDLRGIYLFPGTLSVSGGTALSDTLSVDPGLWSTPTGSLTLTRQWQRDGADIAGAIGLSYTIAAGDQGADITVDVTGNDGTNPPLTAESAAITIPPGEPVDPVEPGEISAVLPPAVSRLCEGQSVADSAEFSAMTDPANFSSTAAPIASVEVTATGAVADVSAPLAEGDLAGFRVTVTDGAGTVAVFDAGQVTVEYKYRIPPLTGNEAHIQVNDLVPDAETLSVTIDSGPYAGTYGPTAGDLRGIYLFPGTLSVSGGTALSDTLSVDPGLWSTPTGSLTLTRQWQRDGADIAGAIGLSYTIAAGDQGADITVDVTGNDGTNPPLTAESAAITIPPGEPVDPVEPGEISAVLPPAVSRLCEGQSVADSAEFSAMTDPANFSSTAAPIASVEVTATGAVADVSAPLAEGDLAGFRVTVTDGAGTVAVFDAGQVTVEYKARVTATSGNEADIDINDLVPDAETLSVTIDSGPYAGTYGPTAGDLRGIYLFPGTLSVSGGTALSDTLSVDPGLWSTPTGSLTLTRQWQRDGADIAGAIGLSYTIAAGDQGADITVDVTGNDGTNPPLTAESAAITIPPGEPVDPVEPGEISAVLPPAVSRLCEGQSVADSAEFSAMTDPANFSSTAAPIASVEVTATGAVADVSAPLAEGDLAGFRVTVTDGAGTVAVFDAGQVTVEYKARVTATSGNEADIDINDLVPDAETLSITIDSGPYAGTYGPTAGDLRGIYLFPGTLSVSGGTALSDTLSVDPGLWSTPTGSLTLTRQWQRDGADIAGAIGLSYTIAAGDQGADITVDVTGNDGTNPPLTAESAAMTIPGGAKGTPTLTEIGTLRSDAISAAVPVSETIDTGAAKAGKRLIVEVAWGDASGDSTTVLAATVSGAPMTKEVEVLAGRQNITILSHDASAGGNVSFEMIPSDAQNWRGYSYRIFLLTDHTSITPLSDRGTVADTLDLSANVWANEIVTGASILANLRTTGDVTFTGLTEAHEFAGQGGKLHHHFGATISADASPRTMTLGVIGDATGDFAAAALFIR